MLRDSFLCFDEYIPLSTTTYTSAELNKRFGAHDHIAFHFLVDNVAAAGQLDIFVDMSADSRNWIQRNNMQLGVTGSSGTTGDVSITLVANKIYQIFWADACASGGNVNSGPGGGGSTGNITYVSTAGTSVSVIGTPLLPYVRIRLVTGSGSGAHVKIHAVLRG